MQLKWFSVILWLGVAVPAWADEADMAFFEKKVRPVLVERCYSCHAAETKQRGGLSLDTKEAILTGGDSGPAVVPGEVEKSLLIKAIRYTDSDLQMPPRGKLPAQVIADLEQWVKMGAPDPRSTGKTAKKYGIDIAEGKKFWAFQLPKKHALPEVKQKDWARGPIDHFLLARLEEKGLRPAADAERITLLRRAYLALIGLPPTPQQIDAFVNDTSPNAFARVVDALLASPHFGERWGRHWLDVARFAESSGGGRSQLFPNAWRYRDYVIHAFNTDKPYNRFLMEQIAGDLLQARSEDERYWQLVALAYLILGPINYEQQDKPLLEADVIDEQLDSLGRGMLGMTIGCARCHDHKFDPIPTSDYYALAGILRSTHSLVHSNVSTWVENPLPLPPAQAAAVAKYEAEAASLKSQITQLKSELKKQGGAAASQGVLAAASLPGIVIDDTQAKRTGQWNGSTFMNTYIGTGYVYASQGNSSLTFAPTITRPGNYEVRLAYLAHVNRATNSTIRIVHADGEKTLHIDQKKIPPIEGRWLSLGKYRLAAGDKAAVVVLSKNANGAVVADAVQFLHETELTAVKPKVKSALVSKTVSPEQLQKLEAALKKLLASAPARPQAMGVKEAAKISDFYICVRGNIHNKGQTVKRGFLQVATYGPMPAISADESGRLQLAQWIASENNPLTARVMVNRLWHHLFGCGLVKSVDNFGSTGDLPSHPELLDYLALRFVEQGWSVKRLIREIMLSHAYQLTSAIDTNDPATRAAVAADGDNRLLWRQNRQRLEAEVMRDTILLVSGQLERKIGGVLFPGKIDERDYKFTETRRSVYSPVFRNNLHELFEVFDFPDPNLVKGARSASTVAPQALFMMNSPFIMDQSRLAAQKALSIPELDDRRRLDLAYRQTLGRLPTERERELALPFLAATTSDEQHRAAWERFYQVLFASMDFRYVN